MPYTMPSLLMRYLMPPLNLGFSFILRFMAVLRHGYRGWGIVIGVLLWAGLGWIGLGLLGTPQVMAAPCYTVSGHQVCILEIRRSAKNYWEYRAAVSVDGEGRSLDLYNCRDRTHRTQDGRLIPFSKDLAGAIVCRLYRG